MSSIYSYTEINVAYYLYMNLKNSQACSILMRLLQQILKCQLAAEHISRILIKFRYLVYLSPVLESTRGVEVI